MIFMHEQSIIFVCQLPFVCWLHTLNIYCMSNARCVLLSSVSSLGVGLSLSFSVFLSAMRPLFGNCSLHFGCYYIIHLFSLSLWTQSSPVSQMFLAAACNAPTRLFLWALAVFRLHRMHEMHTIVTDVRSVCLSVCLSCGSSWLHCAKMAEQIKMVFGVNTLGDPRNIVLDVGLGLPQRGEAGPTFKFWDPPRMSGTADGRDLKFCVYIEGWGP